MEYALAGGVVLGVVILLLYVLPEDRISRWQSEVDTTPPDLRRADDGADRKNQPPNTTWMWD